MSVALKTILVLAVLILESIAWMNKERLSVRSIRQLFKLSLFFALFYCTALISPITDKSDAFWLVADGLMIIPFFLLFAFLYLDTTFYTRFKQGKKNGISNSDRLAVITIILFTIVTRFWLLKTPQKWDCSEYYYALTKACYNFNFKPIESFLLFRLDRKSVV